MLHQGAIAVDVSTGWADSYLDPCLFLPIALGAPAWMLRSWNANFRWSGPFIWMAWIATSLAFEVWIPSFDHRFTSDVWDVLCYALGAVIFSCAESLTK